MTQDQTGMRVLRGAPDAQDLTPTQRACEHEVTFGTMCEPFSWCAGCHARLPLDWRDLDEDEQGAWR